MQIVPMMDLDELAREIDVRQFTPWQEMVSHFRDLLLEEGYEGQETHHIPRGEWNRLRGVASRRFHADR